MRLTLVLRGSNHRFLLKRLRRTKGVLKRPPVTMPEYFEAAGIKVVDPNKEFQPKPRFPEWIDPIQDDPQYPVTDESSIENHPDYNETPIYSFEEKKYLREGLNQALLLTKTHKIEGLPSRVVQNVGKVTIPDQDKLIQRYIMQANVWDPSEEKLYRRKDFSVTSVGWKFKAEYGIPLWKINDKQLQNMIRLCQSLHGVDKELASTRRLTRDHYCKTHVHGLGGEVVQISGLHNFMVSSTKKLSPFADEATVDDTVMSELPNLDPISPYIDLRKINVYTLDNNTGWLPSSSKQLFPHTIYHNHREYWPTPGRMAKAVMYCFANCVATAKALYGDDVKKLPEPICTQWVGIHVNRLHYMCYQLNTLDFSTESGIKNMAWMDVDNDLYNKIIPSRAMLRHTKYEDYDPQVFHKFLAMYLTDVENIDQLQGLLNETLGQSRQLQSQSVHN